MCVLSLYIYLFIYWVDSDSNAEIGKRIFAFGYPASQYWFTLKQFTEGEKKESEKYNKIKEYNKIKGCISNELDEI